MRWAPRRQAHPLQPHEKAHKRVILELHGKGPMETRRVDRHRLISHQRQRRERSDYLPQLSCSIRAIQVDGCQNRLLPRLTDRLGSLEGRTVAEGLALQDVEAKHLFETGQKLRTPQFQPCVD